MQPALYIRSAVGSFLVSNGNITDFQVELIGSKQQVEVAKWIEVAKVASVLHNFLIMLFGKNLCSAESVFCGLAKEKSKNKAECLVGAHVQKLHGTFSHGIDQADTV